MDSVFNVDVMKTMIRKILIILVMIFCILTFGCTSPEKEDLSKNIDNLELEIDKLENDLEDLYTDRDIIQREYNEILEKYNDMIKVEDMFEWLNICDIDAMRANFKIHLYCYDKWLFIKTDDYSQTSSAVLIKTNTDTKFVLTSYYAVNKVNDYEYNEITLYDAFQNEYTGEVVKMNKDYSLALVKINSPGDKLYYMNVADNNPTVGMPICNIYYNENGIQNYMNFSKVDRYITEDESFKFIYNECPTSDTIYGGMAVDLNGKLAGVTVYTYDSGKYVSSVPAEIIRMFMKSAGLSV